MSKTVFKIISCQSLPFLNSLNFVGFPSKFCTFSEGLCGMSSVASVSRNLSMCAVEITTHPPQGFFSLKRWNISILFCPLSFSASMRVWREWPEVGHYRAISSASLVKLPLTKWNLLLKIRCPNCKKSKWSTFIQYPAMHSPRLTSLSLTKLL